MSQEFQDRVGKMVVNGILGLAVALGNQLELFDALEKGSKEKGLDSNDVAEALGLKERYVREWLGAVVTGGLVDVADDGKYFLPEDKAECLSFGRGSRGGGNLGLESWLLPICAGAYEDVVQAFKKDGPLGVPYSRYPRFHEWRHKLTSATFPGFVEQQLLPSAPDLWRRAASDEGIDVCEVGCSEGILTAILAERFPNSRFWASDIGKAEIENANKLKKEKNLTNVTYEVQDAGNLPAEWTEKFDAIVIYDVIHDLPRPDLAIKELHRVLKTGGAALILDIDMSSKLEENIGVPGADVTYAISLFHCMTVSLACGPDAWGLGAAWGNQRAVELFEWAGFKTEPFEARRGFLKQTIHVCVK